MQQQVAPRYHHCGRVKLLYLPASLDAKASNPMASRTGQPAGHIRTTSTWRLPRTGPRARPACAAEGSSEHGPCLGEHRQHVPEWMVSGWWPGLMKVRMPPVSGSARLDTLNSLFIKAPTGRSMMHIAMSLSGSCHALARRLPSSLAMRMCHALARM